MGKTDTDKKLELVRAIRLQNRQDRQLVRFRENLLYAQELPAQRGEIYGLESGAFLAADKGAAFRDESISAVKSKPLSAFRVRVFLAVLLLAAFIICDRTGYSYGGENTDTIFERMTESVEIPTFLRYNEKVLSGAAG